MLYTQGDSSQGLNIESIIIKWCQWEVMLSPSHVMTASSPKIVRNDMSLPLQFDTVNEAFEDFKTALSKTVEANLNLLNELPLPENLPKDKLREFFKKTIESDMKQDPLFEKSIEIGRYSKNMLKKMDAYFKEIFKYHEKLKQDAYGELFQASKMFLDSDLPLSVIEAVRDSLLAETDYTDIFDKEIRREQRDLLINRSNEPKFKRVCDSHNAWIKAFQETQRKIMQERVKLLWYIDFNNSRTLDELFKPKSIRLRFLDRTILSGFTSDLQKHAQEMEKLNMTLVEFNPVPSSEASSEARTILGIMQILDR